jgi:PAS domain S-box-containing protein
MSIDTEKIFVNVLLGYYYYIAVRKFQIRGMAVELRTFTLILGILQLLQVLVFYYQYRVNKNIKGPGWWLLWSLAESLGFFLILLRNIPALKIPVYIAQDPILLSGPIFLYIGVLKFFDRKVNYKSIITFFSAFVFIHLVFLFLTDSILMRSFAFAIGISVLAFLTAYTIHKNKTKPIYLSSNLNIAIFIIHGLFFCFRAVTILLGGMQDNLLAPTIFNFLPYADALIVSLLWSFGFVIMLNQKLLAEASEARSRFEMIFNSSPDAAIISRLEDGMLIDFNESFTKFSGYSSDEIKGHTSLDIQIWNHPSDREKMVSILKEYGFCENHDVLFRRKNGDAMTGLFSARIISLNGAPHILSVTRDITDRKKADELIRMKNEELKQINIEKDKLFSVIAHDLRNPFNAFMGLTELMVEDMHAMSKEEIYSIVNRMKNSCTNLNGLLENLLEWSRVEQNMIRYYPTKENLAVLVAETLSRVNDSAINKDIKIECSIGEEISVYTDKNVMQTVLRNLLFNAVKFTLPGGRISVSATHLPGKDVEISVTDTGIGMSKNMVDNLFNLNGQVNRKGTNGEPSTGLGLILCKGFIENQGGKIWVESEQGKGSTFCFTLPAGY